MGDDIGSGLSSMAVCFDFRSTNIVQLSNQNLYYYRFRCHHPLITQLSIAHTYITKSTRKTASFYLKEVEVFAKIQEGRQHNSGKGVGSKYTKYRYVEYFIYH